MSNRALVLILWIAAGMGFAELALEVRAHARGYDTLLFREPARETGEPGASAADPYGPTEAFPFRSRVVAPERSQGTVRYWIASSSHAEDDVLPKSQIFPNVLARELDARGRSAQVLNASRAGELIADNLRDVDALAPTWRPDYVVLYQMSLDVSALSARYLGGNEAAEPGVPAAGREAEADPGWTVRLIESTTLWALIKVNVTSRITQARVLAPELGDEAMAEFRRGLVEFVRGVRAQGSTPVLCTFAAMHDRDDLGRFSANAITSIFRFNVHLSLEGWIDAIEQLNAAVLEVAAEEGVPVVDVGGAVNGRSELFRDFVHFTPEGHARVAEVLADQLPPGSGQGG